MFDLLKITLPWSSVSREVSILFTKDRFRHCFGIFARGLCSKHCLTSLELLFCTDAATKSPDSQYEGLEVLP